MFLSCSCRAFLFFYSRQVQSGAICRAIKNFGGKNVWRIRTVGNLAVKFWRIEVHLHRECYRNYENWWQNVAKCCNLPNLPKFFSPLMFYCMLNILLICSVFDVWSILSLKQMIDGPSPPPSFLTQQLLLILVHYNII